MWEQFKQQRSENPDLKFAVCLDIKNPVVMDADSLLIDEDEQTDLVTFDMHPLLPACRGLNFYNLDKSPPPPVKEGKFIFFVGFPGRGRETTENAVGFPRQACGVVSTQVGKFKFYSDVSNLKKEAEDFAGISGTPCFMVKEHDPLRLIGFATGYAMNMISFAYASCITRDGKIQPIL